MQEKLEKKLIEAGERNEEWNKVKDLIVNEY